MGFVFGGICGSFQIQLTKSPALGRFSPEVALDLPRSGMTTTANRRPPGLGTGRVLVAKYQSYGPNIHNYSTIHLKDITIHLEHTINSYVSLLVSLHTRSLGFWRPWRTAIPSSGRLRGFRFNWTSPDSSRGRLKCAAQFVEDGEFGVSLSRYECGGRHTRSEAAQRTFGPNMWYYFVIILST